MMCVCPGANLVGSTKPMTYIQSSALKETTDADDARAGGWVAGWVGLWAAGGWVDGWVDGWVSGWLG